MRAFSGGERLGEVVVGAQVQGGDLVVVAVADGQDEDGNGKPRPKLAAHLEPALAGKREIEHDEVWLARGSERQSILAGRGQFHLVLARGQDRAHRAPDLFFVVDHEHAYGTLGGTHGL
jgi:hypothetical protein